MPDRRKYLTANDRETHDAGSILQLRKNDDGTGNQRWVVTPDRPGQDFYTIHSLCYRDDLFFNDKCKIHIFEGKVQRITKFKLTRLTSRSVSLRKSSIYAHARVSKPIFSPSSFP